VYTTLLSSFPIVLFVTVSRHAIHHDNISNSLADQSQHSFKPLHLKFFLHIVLGKDTKEKWPTEKSSERFLVLAVKFTAILDCETLWAVTRVKSSYHADFYGTFPSNRGHFRGMI